MLRLAQFTLELADSTTPVVLNLNYVTAVLPRGSGCAVKLLGEDTIYALVESFDQVAQRLWSLS